MFHLELRQFPHVARAFNLSREELDARFARPWASGTVVRFEDRAWNPEKGRLTVYEGPELLPQDMGMGRGWATVGRTSAEVTETILAEASRGTETRSAVETFKAIVRGAARTPISFDEVIALAAAEHPGQRPSECLAMAEQAVWELLHQSRVVIMRGGEDVAPDAWGTTVLSWKTWAGGEDAPVLRAL